MKIFHISDSHVSSPSHFNIDSFEKAYHEYENDVYDLLIHSGDITQGGQKEEYQKASELFDKHVWPDVLVPGNHDKRSGGLSLFEKYIGDPNGVKIFDDTLIVRVDSGVPDKNDGRVGMVTFNMVKNNLKKYQNKDLKILILHHHLVPIPMTGRERNVLTNAGDLLELVLGFDVDLVLMGHKHYPNVYKIENTVFVNAGTVSDKKTRHGDVNSYNTITVEKEKIDVKIKRLDDTETFHSFPRKEKHIYHNFGAKHARIVQMSNSYISQSSKFQKTHFEKARSKINNTDSDLIIHCGGIVEEGIKKNYDSARKLFSRFDPPLLFTPAGRDINYLGYRLFPHYFGDFDQEYETDGIIFKGISSSQYDSKTGFIGETERKQLFESFQDYEDKFTCLFLHHNVIPIPHAREKGLLEDSGDLLHDIVKHNIDLVLTGTSSHPYALKINNTVIVNANSLSSVYTRSFFGNSYNLIDIFEKNIVVTEINSLWGNKKILGIWERE